jgi:hypothetical protein
LLFALKEVGRLILFAVTSAMKEMPSRRYYSEGIVGNSSPSQAGVTMVALSARTFRPNALALTANLRRGRHQTAIAHRTGREEPDSFS